MLTKSSGGDDAPCIPCARTAERLDRKTGTRLGLTGFEGGGYYRAAFELR